jgi:hypothetical protein
MIELLIMMNYKLFLDDIRSPPEFGWIIARSYDNAVNIVKILGVPMTCSLDHDLGADKTGYDFAKFLVDYDMQTNDIDSTFNFTVHSANPVGAENITKLLNNYIKFKNENKSDTPV